MHLGRSKEKSVELRANDKVMENVNEISYLGDKVSQTGKHNSNIKARIGKGLGIISEIFSILDNVSFGPYFFKIALLLRQSLLVSSCLYNCQCWYNLTDKDINDLSSLDVVFFTRLFGLPKTTPRESFYLETGEVDFETEIKKRRILYFQKLMKRNKKSLPFCFPQAQI